MIEETGVVTAVEGAHAWVETERQTSCGGCAAKGCGTGALSRVFAGKRQRVRVENGIGARVGDTIVLGLREDALVRGSLAVYIVPLLGMLFGSLFGETLAPQLGAAEVDTWAIVTGALGFGMGLLWLRGFSRRAGAHRRYQAVALRVAGNGRSVRIAADELVKR